MSDTPITDAAERNLYEKAPSSAAGCVDSEDMRKLEKVHTRLNAAYLRIRAILETFNIPYALTPEQVWTYTEEKARQLVIHKRRLADMLPLFEEARDALTALTVSQCQLHNIRLDLADRMDQVGEAEAWKAMDAKRQGETK